MQYMKLLTNIKGRHHMTAWRYCDLIYFKLFKCFIIDDFRFAALLWWIIFFFASLSSIEFILGRISSASFLLVLDRISFNALRMVFA